MTTTTGDSAIYYDPFDIEIDMDPYPVWRRMREEAPLYRNEKLDFYALSRFDEGLSCSTPNGIRTRVANLRVRPGRPGRDLSALRSMSGVADVELRPARPGDQAAIEAMYARCSVESRYGRFLAPLPRIPSEHLRRVVTPASGDEAWVVEMTRDDPDTVVALGSWSPAADRDAELALLVEDAWQCCGIGTARGSSPTARVGRACAG